MQTKTYKAIVTALLVLLMAGLAMGATPVNVQVDNTANDMTAPALVDGHGTGLVIPAALKNSDFELQSVVLKSGTYPGVWDWRNEGGVTSVKNQGACGSCYAFATLGSTEGFVLNDSGTCYNFSEEQSKECIWETTNTMYGSCNGGWAEWVINLLTREGIVIEADYPYTTTHNAGCDSSKVPVERVTEWFMISGGNVPDPDTMKGYIYNYGPIFTTFDAGCLSGYTGGVISGEGFYDINHAVVIVGWNDSLTYTTTTGTGTGAWIVKNSWGDSWGDAGYFYIAYSGAEIGSYSSMVADYEGYKSNVRTLNYDESGWKDAWSYGQSDAWGLCKFDTADEEVTRIEFWTTGSTSDVDLYLYDGFDGSYLGTQIYADEDLSFNEPGYHSVAVESPVVSDGEIVVVAHITNINSVYGGSTFFPIAADYNDYIESGMTYMSSDGTNGSWTDMGMYAGEDIALRIRVDSGDSPKIMEVWNELYEEEYCYTAGDIVTVGAIVYDPDGCDDIDTVTANFSEHGIEELVEMELVECHDGYYAEYRAEVQVTQSTCELDEDYHGHRWCSLECEYIELPVYVIATDMEGQNDTRSTDFCVEADEPHHLEVTGPDAKFEFPCDWDCAKMEKKMCCWDDSPWWGKENGWENCRDFNSSVAYLDVMLYDQYGNFVDDTIHYQNLYITNDGTTEYVHAGSCKWDWNEEEGCHQCCNKLWVIDEISEIVEFTVFYCDGSDHSPEVLVLLNELPESVACDTHVVTFTNLTDTLDVTVEDTVVYSGYDLTANVSAQLVDEFSNVLPVAGVPVLFSTDNPNIAEFNDEWATTDENGIATAVLNSYDGTESGNVMVYAAAECRSGYTGFDVVDPVLSYVLVYTEHDSLEFGESSEISYECFTYNDMLINCTGAVASATLGTFNGTDFVAGDVEGVAVISLNVSGVVGTVNITINGIDCDGWAANPIPGEEFTVESGTVSITGNFTGNGTVCVQALGDPIPEWSNDTKGAVVCVETHEGFNETVTLDLNGTGDTWKYDDGNWSLYVTGDTCEVELGILQKFALVYDEPEPEPDPEPTATKRRRSSSGGSGWIDTPVNNTTAPISPDDDKYQDDPVGSTEVEDKSASSDSGKNATADVVAETDDEDDGEGKTPNPLPGFAAIFAIAGILAVAYLIGRKRG